MAQVTSYKYMYAVKQKWMLLCIVENTQAS